MRSSIRFLGVFTLLVFLSVGASAQGPAKLDPNVLKEIDELELRIKKLQEKLKAIRESGQPEPKPVAALDAMPANLDKLFAWRSIGPANMGGRITALAVVEADPTCYYAATASGGLLKTINNGSTFAHQFDREGTVSIGAVAVAPSNRNIVWVGTGEANPRNSVSFGDGVYKSVDGGKTWKNMGLAKSFQIGKIVIHPKDPDIVYVGALGRLYGPNQERGLYKTTDGGKTWHRVWHLDDKTGVIDIVMSPSNPDILLMGAWDRQRDEFDTFVGDAKPPAAADDYAPAENPRSRRRTLSLRRRRHNLEKTHAWLASRQPRPHRPRLARKNPNLVFAIIDSDKAGTGMRPVQGIPWRRSRRDAKGREHSGLAGDQPGRQSENGKGGSAPLHQRQGAQESQRLHGDAATAQSRRQHQARLSTRRQERDRGHHARQSARRRQGGPARHARHPGR